MRYDRHAILATSLVLALGAQAHGQAANPQGLIGFNGALARPVGEFQNYVDWGGGLGLYGVVNLDRGNQIGLRLGSSFLIYGHERFATPLLPATRRVWVDVSTDNFIVDFGVGPQITFGRGPLRPYVYGTAGFAYFATVSSVDGVDGGPDFAHTTNFDDVTYSLTGGGGILMALSRKVALDLSAQWTHNGEVEYLTRGDIVENWDGSITVYPVRSEANLMTFRFGVAIRL
jgi:opacity protein-like surface antigen